MSVKGRLPSLGSTCFCSAPITRVAVPSVQFCRLLVCHSLDSASKVLLAAFRVAASLVRLETMGFSPLAASALSCSAFSRARLPLVSGYPPRPIHDHLPSGFL